MDGTGLVTEEAERLDFEPFFEAEYPRLVRMMYLLTGDAEEAEDLAQEALARAFERWPKISVMATPGGYVYKTALNLSRKRGRRRHLQAREVEDRPGHDDLGSAETRSDVTRALASLPVGEREAVVLVEWLGMGSEEVANLLGIAPSSVRSRLHRARGALRRQLEIDDA